MSKYCPKCKQNFSDSFEECVYCNTPLVNGLIEIDDVSTPEPHTMSDSEILEQYKDYRKNIESEIGHELSDAEFLNVQPVKAQTLRKSQLHQRLVQYSCGVYYHKR